MALTSKQTKSAFRAFVLGILLAPAAGSSWGAVVAGYFEGLFFSDWTLYRQLSPEIVAERYVYTKQDARIYFAFDTSVAPEAVCRDNGCSYYSDRASPNAVAPSWLHLAFDFGSFRGVSDPSMTLRQSFAYYDNFGSQDRMELRYGGSS